MSITRRLRQYEQLRLATPPARLGQIDWILWGMQSCPWPASTIRARQYRAGFIFEKHTTPSPGAMRLRRPKR